MTIKNRLAQLEKRTPPQDETNPYMTMDMQEVLARAWQAVKDGNGKVIDPKDLDPLRADILRRLERIAEAHNDNQKSN